MFVIEKSNGDRFCVPDNFDRLTRELNKAIVLPCTLRVGDFTPGQDVLACVLEGLRKRWEPQHSETVLAQLGRLRHEM